MDFMIKLVVGIIRNWIWKSVLDNNIIGLFADNTNNNNNLIEGQGLPTDYWSDVEPARRVPELFIYLN